MKSSTPLSITLSLRIYRWLLYLGPADYRREYAEPTLQVFRQCCQDAYQRRGTPGVVGLWLPMFGDALLGMVTERQVLRPRFAWPMLAALFLVLFPFSWLSRVWPEFGVPFNYLFATARAHQIGHVTLFFAVTLLILSSFPTLRQRPILSIVLMMSGAIGEEVIQALFAPEPAALIETRTLLLDFAGIIAACLLIKVWSRSRLPVRKEI